MIPIRIVTNSYFEEPEEKIDDPRKCIFCGKFMKAKDRQLHGRIHVECAGKMAKKFSEEGIPV